MFSYVRGKLISKTTDEVVVEVQGIGYLIYIPHSLSQELPPVHEELQMHTSFVVREFSQTLYGFLDKQERDVFEILLNLTGVGPKLALSLIGYLPLNKLQSAVLAQDVHALCKVPGVGKKTAERLIVELKDKLSSFSSIILEDMLVVKEARVESPLIQDAILALIQLGYTQSTAYKAVKKSILETEQEIDLSVLITAALRNT